MNLHKQEEKNNIEIIFENNTQYLSNMNTQLEAVIIMTFLQNFHYYGS